ncbi:carboxypeptidase-like regulatory domain-containing protein [Polynucleobacter sp. MWH-UH25E]|uniref:carboxypeptidase-like regulatory domain-containing protein n=1 Tax=Polynucleobacter sp. MWH-UH25E TaxID=1855616 RepID=UPI001BFE4E81|nr:carboxypeptidase-like regulatory domain-containing protein [Polynucleobacter sp. MWH-UH25E]QWD61202.1 carboxypeptidase regulatory-like domain-containing protein [Polynucleobacter sp. MWH-UH25E]
MRTLLKHTCTCLLFVLGGFAFAQIPATQHSNGISYISGGVGEEETVAILAQAKQWPVLLELSQIENGRGVWIFGANIQITNTKKQVVFNVSADGPYMLINLEPGDYSIEASYQGVEQKRALSVKANASQKISLFWK